MSFPFFEGDRPINSGSKGPLHQAHCQPFALSELSFQSSAPESSDYGRGQPHTSQADAQILCQPSVPSQHYERMLGQDLSMAERKNQAYETTITIAPQPNSLSFVENDNQDLLHRFNPSSITKTGLNFRNRLSARLGTQDVTPGTFPTLDGTAPLPPSWLDSRPIIKRRRSGDPDLARKKARHSFTTSASLQHNSADSHSKKPDWFVEKNTEVDRTVNLISSTNQPPALLRSSQTEMTFQSTDDVQSLRQQLASAQAELQEYRNLKDNICQDCKTKVTPSPKSDPFSVLVDPCSNLSKPTNHRPRIPSQPFPTKHPDSGLTRPSIQRSNFNSEFFPNLKASTLKHLPRPQTSKPFTTVTVPATASVTAIPSGVRPEWSVQYRTTERRGIDVTFVRAFSQEAYVACVKFSQDGKYLAAAIGDLTGKAVIWEVKSSMETCVLREPSQKLGIKDLCFTPDGKHLATTGTDSRIRLWNISKKRMRSVFATTAITTALDTSPNGRFLACASVEGIIMWRIRDGSKKVFSSHHSYSFIRFSQNGLYIAAVDSRNTLRIWNIRTGHRVTTWTKQNVRGLRAHCHQTHRFWTVSSVGVNGTAEEDQEKEALWFTGHKPIFDSFAVAVSPDGRWVASSSKDVNVHIWGANNGLRQCSLLGHTEWTRTIDFNPMGNYLAVGNGKDVSLWRYKIKAN